MDLDRTIVGSLWLFNKQLLVFSIIGRGEDPLKIPLLHVNIWVLVSDLKPGFMKEEVAVSLGNFVVKFIEYDAKSSTRNEDSPMRMRVQFDIHQPLRRKKKMVDVF